MVDFSVVLAPLMQLWWLVLIIVIFAFFKSPIGKGMVGESLLNFFISIFLNKNEYRLLKDVTLPTQIPK